jgi:hypothetical protein
MLSLGFTQSTTSLQPLYNEGLIFESNKSLRHKLSLNFHNFTVNIRIKEFHSDSILRLLTFDNSNCSSIKKIFISLDHMARPKILVIGNNDTKYDEDLQKVDTKDLILKFRKEKKSLVINVNDQSVEIKNIFSDSGDGKFDGFITLGHDRNWDSRFKLVSLVLKYKNEKKVLKYIPEPNTIISCVVGTHRRVAVLSNQIS